MVRYVFLNGVGGGICSGVHKADVILQMPGLFNGSANFRGFVCGNFSGFWCAADVGGNKGVSEFILNNGEEVPEAFKARKGYHQSLGGGSHYFQEGHLSWPPLVCAHSQMEVEKRMATDKDDMLIISKENVKVENLRNLLKAKFEMKEFREATKILRMNIKRDRQKGKRVLNKEDYIHKLIKRFFMEEAKITKQPITYHLSTQLSKAQCPTEPEHIEELKEIPYSNVVRSAMYLIVCTRLDLVHTMSILSKNMANPGKEHW
uniref:Reverse transcriptase Ty1/copia-type domain-containing protein n=1 Tax=Cannabis sativa TaxID=3483 RepID=A0A803P6I0_CANSA